MQDVFLDRGPNPPHGIGRQPEAAVGIEALDRLHHPDIALGDELRHRQAITAVAHRDLGHQPQMAGDQPMRCFGIAMLAPTLGEHELLIRLEHWKLADFLEVAGKPAFGTHSRQHQSTCHIPANLPWPDERLFLDRPSSSLHVCRHDS